MTEIKIDYIGNRKIFSTDVGDMPLEKAINFFKKQLKNENHSNSQK